MALALDATTPARVTATTTVATSGAFTPPAGSLLVVCTSSTGGSQANPTIAVTTVTGSTSSWTELGRATRTTTSGTTANNGAAAVHWATVSSSVSTTIRSTQTTGSTPTSIKVYVITGFNTTTPAGNARLGKSNLNTVVTTSFNTTQNNVYTGLSITEWTVPTAAAPTSSNLAIGKDMYTQSTNLGGGSGFDSVATSGTAETFTVDRSGTSAADWLYVTFEVYPASTAITATPTGIATAVAFGTAVETGSLTASPTGIATAVAFGTPVETGSLTVSPTGIVTAGAFGTVTATIAAGGITASPTGVATAETFGTTTAQVPRTATPTGIATAEAFGTTSVLGPTLTFTAGTSVEGTASVTSETVTLPSGLVSGDYTIIFASLNSSAGGITTPNGWTNILASTDSVNGSTSDHFAIFYRKWVSGDGNVAVTCALGRFCLTPVRVEGADATTFVDVAASVTQSAAAAATQTAPSITPTSEWLVCSFNGRDAASNITQTPYSNLSASMTMIAEASGVSTSTNAGHCVAYEQVTANSATGTRQVNPAYPVDGGMGVSFSLNVAAGSSAVTASPGGIATAEAFGTAGVTYGALVSSPAGIATTVAFGTLSVTVGGVIVSPTAISSAELFGTPVSTGALAVSPTGIVSGEAFGTAEVWTDVTYSPSGIATAETFGTVTATFPAPGTGISLNGTPSLYEIASGTTAVIPYPSGIVSGELLLAHVGLSNVTAPTTSPSGWTLHKAQNGNNAISASVWYRIADGSETGSVTFDANATAGRVTGIMERWGGVDTSTPFDVAAGGSGVAIQIDYTAPSVTTVTDNAEIVYTIVLNASSSSDINTPSGLSKVSGATGTGRRTGVFNKTQVSYGAVGTQVFTQTGATNLQWTGIVTALRPGAGGGATTVSPTGIATGETFGTVVVSLSGGPITATPTGIATGQAFGTATVYAPVLPTMTRCVQGIPGTTTHAIKINTSDATSVRLKAGTNSGLTTGVVWGAAGTPDALGNTELTISGLSANTPYYYRVAVTDSAASESLDTWTTVGEFTTDQDAATSFTVAFGACCNNTDSTAIGAIAAKKPDLFLHLGDEWYADGTGTSLANFRTKMGDKKTATNHKAVYRTSASNVVPSDHDGMANNSNAGLDATAWANYNTVYREMNVAAGLPTGGHYRTFKRGRVRFIALDRRSFATIPSATDNSSKTCLGATQKQWFKDQIDAATEPLIIVQQGDPWIGSAIAGDDGWLGYTTERTELANYMAASGKDIAMIAGDMHAVAAEDGSGSPGGVAVFHAAPFDNNASQKGGPYDVGPYPSTGTAVVQQYGWLDITDSGGAIQVVFQGFSADNTQRVTLTKTYYQNVTATPTGIGSAEAFGTPTETGSLTASPSGIASAETFGTLTARVPRTVTITGVASAETFGAVTAQLGMLTASPGSVASAEVFGTPSATVGASVVPTGIASLEAFGTPTAIRPVTATPTGIASLGAFGTVTVVGTSTFIPTGIASAEVFGAVVAFLPITAAPTGIPTAEYWGVTTIQFGGVILSPSGIATGETFGTVIVSAFPLTQPTGIPSAEAFGTPTVTGALTASPTGIGTGEWVSNINVILGMRTLSPTGIPTAVAFGTPGTTNNLRVVPDTIATGETFGTTTHRGSLTATPTGITTQAQPGFPTVTYATTMSPTGIASALAFGTTAVTIGTDFSRNLSLTFTMTDERFALSVPLGRFNLMDTLERFTTGAPSWWTAADTLERFTTAVEEGEEMTRDILKSAGANEYVGGTITENTGKDITAATVKVSLGSEVQPGTWVDPATNVLGPNNVRKVTMLVGLSPDTPKGAYWLWVKVTDTPEVLTMRFPQKIVVR